MKLTTETNGSLLDNSLKYETPKIEIVQINCEDILLASGDLGGLGDELENDQKWSLMM